MIKHFCDICHKEISGTGRIDNVTLLTDLIIMGQFAIQPSHETKCEICVSCAKTLVETVEEMRKGRGVVYVEKK